MKFLNSKAQRDVLKVWHLGLFMYGFMMMTFGVLILPLGSPRVIEYSIMGLIGVGLVAWHAKYAMENTPVSVGLFAMIFGLAIAVLGWAELFLYGATTYHTPYWGKFCFVFGLTLTVGFGITYLGVRIIIGQMRKEVHEN